MLYFRFEPTLAITRGTEGGGIGVSLEGCLTSGWTSSGLGAGSGRTMTFFSGLFVDLAMATGGAGDGESNGELPWGVSP